MKEINLDEDMKWALLILFVAQNILTRSWKFKTIERICQFTTHSSVFILAFYERIHLGPNQSLIHILRFSSRCKDLSVAIPEVKKL